MRPLSRTLVTLVASLTLVACAQQEATDSEASASASSTPTEAPTAEATSDSTEAATSSPSAEAADICDLILLASDAPDGSEAVGEPEVQTLDFYRDAVEETAEGSPGRASAEMNLENYESWGFVERCSVRFANDASGAGFTSFAMRFEDETGSAGWVESLGEGCEVLELPASSGVDGIGVFCNLGLPTAYVAVTVGPIVQAVSVSAPPGSTADGAALLDQAAAVVEAMPAP